MPRYRNDYDTAKARGLLWTPTVWRGSKLWGWWDVADAATVEIGTGISKLKDKSGNGRDFVQTTTARQPLWHQFSMGRPHAYFDALSDHYLKWNGTAISSTTLAVFVTIEPYTSSDDGARIFSAHLAAGVNDWDNVSSFIFYYDSSPSNVIGSYRNTTDLNPVALPLVYGPPQMVGTIFDGTNQRTYVNGSESAAAASSGTFAFDEITVGTERTGSTYPGVSSFTGLIRSIAIVTGGLSRQERFLLEGALAWAASGEERLIGTHPFKNRPPLIGD